MTTTEIQVTPDKIMQVGLGFWASKTLLAAVELDLFSYLSTGEKGPRDIQKKLKLHDRAVNDFLDTLVALGFLERNGLKESAVYTNSPDVNLFLVKGKPTYVGGMLQMANNRLYPFWGNLEEALRTGQPQNESSNGGTPLFEAIYANENTLREFLEAMASIQMGNFMQLAQKFDFSQYQSFVDMGGANASLSCLVKQQYPHLACTSFDLSPVAPIAMENIKKMGLEGQVQTQSGDFFKDIFPQADVITMGNVLHDWSEDEKLLLMKKAYDSLSTGGAFIAIENVIDSERKKNAFGLMMSLNMLIETPEGFDYSTDDFEKWAHIAGFSRVEFIPLTGPSSAAIAYK